MSKRRTFILSKNIYKHLEGRGQLKACRICGKLFKIGEKVISVPVHNKQGCGHKWYCLKCAKKYNIWF